MAGAAYCLLVTLIKTVGGHVECDFRCADSSAVLNRWCPVEEGSVASIGRDFYLSTFDLCGSVAFLE